MVQNVCDFFKADRKISKILKNLKARDTLIPHLFLEHATVNPYYANFLSC